MTVLRFLLITSLVHIALNGTAVAECPEGIVPVQVTFMNGMLTPDEAAADDSRAALERVIINDPRWQQIRSDCVEFNYSYNRMRFLGGDDVFDVLIQYFGTNVGNGLRELQGLLPISSTLSDAITSLATFVDIGACLATGADCARLENAIVAAATADRPTKTVAVAHSQGNFYINAIYHSLLGSKRVPPSLLAVVAVATPSAETEGVGPCTNLRFDPVAILSGLPWNADNMDGCRRFDCHSFQWSYLAGADSRSRISDHVLSQLPRIAVPPPPPPPSSAVARDDSYVAIQGMPFRIDSPGLLANDSVPSGVTPIVDFIEPFPAISFVNLGAGGLSIDFRQTPSLSGSLVLNYVIHSGAITSNSARVSIDIRRPAEAVFSLYASLSSTHSRPSLTCS